MAFRRQDIPKTTRAGKDGQPRRLYPRYLRDRTLWPSIERAIAYLDEMVGRRRGELREDAMLELFGDPKLARCILACLGNRYRFETLTFAEALGEETATRLAEHGAHEPADLRDLVYRTVELQHRGVLGPEGRPGFLADLGQEIGVPADLLDEALHLDAERNQRLVRIGARPEVPDIVARYNALLTLSVLRQASTIELELPGLSPATVETIAARWDIAPRRHAGNVWRLRGRQDARGSWARFGAKLARCAIHCLILCPETPSGWAQVHFGDRTARFVLDEKTLGAIRPRRRLAAAADGLIRAAQLAAMLSEERRQPEQQGWTVRRALEPLIADGVIVLPELTIARDRTSVAVVPVSTADDLSTLERLRTAQPVIALGRVTAETGVPVITGASAGEVWAVLDSLAGETPSVSPHEVIHAELEATGWVPSDRLADLLGAPEPHEGRLAPILTEASAELVAGVGLCRLDWLAAWHRRYVEGGLDVRSLRAHLAAELGDRARADALTLHLLSHPPLATARPAA